MFRRRDQSSLPVIQPAPSERVNSVIGNGIVWKGSLSGTGGLRIEGAFEGNISLRGMLVVGESGRVTCETIRASTVIIAGAVRGDITAEKVEIRATGRVWGNVVTAAFATEEGAFLRGQIRMEERVEIGALAQEEPLVSAPAEPLPETQPPASPEARPVPGDGEAAPASPVEAGE